MSRAPLVLFVYNRLDHVKKVLDSLEQNYLAKETDLYVFSDDSAKEKDARKVEDVRNYIREYAKKSCFKCVNIIEAENHKGLARSVIEGITTVISEFEKVIVVEDDVVVSKDFLNFMNDCLDFYREDSTVWSITGIGYNMKTLERYDHDVFLVGRMGSDCWAIWKDRWDLIDWNVSDYLTFKSSFMDRLRFNKFGSDMSSMLIAQMEGRVDSWAIRADYAQYRHGMMTIHPKRSFMESIGHDGTGTHNGKVDIFNWKMKRSEFDYKLESIKPSRKIVSSYKRIYSKTRIIGLILLSRLERRITK